MQYLRGESEASIKYKSYRVRICHACGKAFFSIRPLRYCGEECRLIGRSATLSGIKGNTLDPFVEAQLYVDKAKDVLDEDGGGIDEDGDYKDRLGVRLAGHAAWCGVITALEAIFPIGEDDREDIDRLYDVCGDRDRKLMKSIHKLYDTLHLSMGYDGYRDSDAAEKWLNRATEVIAKLKTMSPVRRNE